MDLDVSSLLVEWGFSELVEVFRAEDFDLDSLWELDNTSLSPYLPTHGRRLKLLSKIRKLKESLQTPTVELLVVNDQTAFGDIGLNSGASDAVGLDAYPSATEPFQDVQPPAKRSYEEVVLEDTLVKTALETLDIKAVLEGDSLCKHTLRQLAGGVEPFGDWRNRIVDVLVSQSLLPISRHLSLAQLKGVAEKLVELMPGEQLSTYYLDADHTRRLVSGKLVDKYNNLKAKFKDSNSKRQRSSASSSSAGGDIPCSSVQSYTAEERRQSLAWLMFNRTPWPEVLRHWAVVYQDRIKFLLPRPPSKKENKIEIYYREYPVLTDKAGWQLLVADFENLYPDKTGCLFAAWPTIQQALLSTAATSARDPFATEIISKLQNPTRVTESAQILLHLMLIPSIFKTNASVAFPSNSKSGPKRFWKPSSAESRDGFIMHVKDASDIKNRLKIRQDQMEKLGLKCQPLVVICGPTLVEFTHCQVSINGILYTVPGPLQAVDLAFKSFQVLHAWYPIECEH